MDATPEQKDLAAANQAAEAEPAPPQPLTPLDENSNGDQDLSKEDEELQENEDDVENEQDSGSDDLEDSSAPNTDRKKQKNDIILVDEIL